ncbi:MAG: hypothetical protein HY710_05405 [Candidatus Latescibacteria bacterium]|nr:hypothetical protein [Candidatus Latescibacterota bacterium]
MGHALEEIHRVLTPQGIVVDIHPNRPADTRNRLVARPQVYGMTGGRMILVGALQDRTSHYRAADRTVQQALRQGLFILLSSEAFPHRYYFRTLAVLDQYLATQWTAASIGASLRRRLQAFLGAHPQAQIMVETSVRMNVMSQP